LCDRRSRSADIERVVLVGCSGSGKTTLARSVSRALNAPHVELDAIFHQSGWTQLPDEEFLARVELATNRARWVVDGNYSVVREVVWSRADTVVWFDMSLPFVLSRTIRRTLRRVVTREELWNGNREPFSNLWSVDPEKSIIAWTATQHGKYRRRYLDAEKDPHWSGLHFVRLRSQGDADAFLAEVVSGAREE
jgi:adenylate kinase family enzyme